MNMDELNVRLELRTNDAYDTVLHVKGGGVVGAWTVDHGPECPLKHMLADNSPENWDDGPLMAGEPTDPDAYGELVYSVCDEGLWTVPDKKRLRDRLTFHLGEGSAIVAALDVDA